MTIKTILQKGNPFLLQKVQAVSSFDMCLSEHIDDMLETMRSNHGVGLAANQIGVDQRIIMIEVNNNPRYPGQQKLPLMVFINPQIIVISDEMESTIEGCLSVPGYRGEVLRYKSISYQAYDAQGKPFSGHAEGFLARVIQHEVDHLNGILIA
ncbi:MAG: peptide deformylase [Pseudomonadota bacterium]